jgi:hypothetical protein
MTIQQIMEGAKKAAFFSGFGQATSSFGDITCKVVAVGPRSSFLKFKCRTTFYYGDRVISKAKAATYFEV